MNAPDLLEVERLVSDYERRPIGAQRFEFESQRRPGPQRFQRTRQKGHRLPEGTVCVTRGTKWGNPFMVRPGFTQAEATALFERELVSGRLHFSVAEVQRELAGKNLACWCKPGSPCHAETLLRIANAEGGGRQP